MKIAYNPLGSAAYIPAADNKDLIFDLVTRTIYAKGIPFDGTKYNTFKKHTSPDNTGGSEGLVPIPSYSALNNRLLREDGLWVLIAEVSAPDDALSLESTNSVENKVITKKFNEIIALLLLKAEHVYKNIVINGVLLLAQGANDTLTIIQGDGIALTPNSDNKSITISTKALGLLGIDISYSEGLLIAKVADTYYARWNEVFNWYQSVTEEDTDIYINKWQEIVDFLNNVLSGTNILDEFVTRKTAQIITGYKVFSLDSETAFVVDNQGLTNDKDYSSIFFGYKNEYMVGIGGASDKYLHRIDLNGNKFRILDEGNYKNIIATNLYWANVPILSASDSSTSPTFLNATITGTLQTNLIRDLAGNWLIGLNPETADINIGTAAKNHYIALQTTTADNEVFINDLGNTGIGTKTPAAKLHVVGTTKLDGLNYIISFSPNYNDTWSDGTNSHPWYGYDHRYRNTGVYNTVISDFYGMTLKTRNGNISITEAGNVGIGTVGPADKLDVAGIIRSTANSRYLRIGSQNSSHAHYETNADTSHWFNKRVDVNGAIWRYGTSYGIDSDGKFYAHTVYANISGSGTAGGVSLYSNSDPMTYGIASRNTADYGTHGLVTGDWATYLTMSNTANRGWIFRTTAKNVFSINTAGYLHSDSSGYFVGNLSSANSGASNPGDAALEVREYARAGTDTSIAPHTLMYAPRIGFHWSNRYWGNIIYYDSTFRFMNNNASAYVPIQASTITGGTGNFTNLTVINDSSNTGYDALAYFRNYGNADWAVKIDCSTSYTHGLHINSGGDYALMVGPGNSKFTGAVTIGADATPSYTLDVRGKIRATGRIYANEWIEFSGSSGLLWPNANGAHLLANTTTSYAGLMTQGARNGYCGLHCGPNTNYMTVMSTDVHHGLYCENWGWEFYFNRSNSYVGIRSSSTPYPVSMHGDSYTNGWSRAASGFYVEGTGVHYTSQGSVGEIDMSSNNEFLWGSGDANLFFNYRAVSRGKTVTNYIWNAGSSSTYASHTLGKLYVKNVTLSTTLPTYDNAPVQFNATANNNDTSNARYQPWISGKDSVNSYGYGVTVSNGLYRDPGYSSGGYYIGCGWDGNASSCLWKFSRNGILYGAGGFAKSGSSDSYVLLGGGGHKALSDFAMASAYVKKAGDTMTGSLNFTTGNVIITTASTSNYKALGVFYKGSASASGTYDAQIGWHNTGNTNGALTLLPYATTTSPWDGSVGLYITKTLLKYNGASVWHSGNDGSGSGLDADLLDGTHKTGLLTALSSSSSTNLSITVGGTTKSVTDLYARKLALSSTTITSTANDTTAKWGPLGTSVHHYDTTGLLTNQPSLFGLLLNVTTGGREVHLIWMTLASGNLYHRGGNAAGWSGSWRTILDTGNYSSYLGYIGTTAVLKSSATQALTGISRISNSTSAALYLGNSGNQSWVMTQDICSHSGSGNWAINIAGTAWFKNVNIGYTYNATSGYNLGVTGTGYISSTLTMGGVINTCSTAGSWVSGMTNASIKFNSLTAINNSSYYPILGVKANAGHVVNFGAYVNSVGFYGYYNGRTANSTDWSFTANTANGNWTATASIYAAHFYENSDLKLKTNIQEILNSDKMPIIKEFDWKEDGSHSYGLIAQELEEQGYSELVSVKDDGYKTVNYSAALSLIVGKLQVKIKELEKEIEILKNKN